jgi:hypothetical protein
MATVAKLEAAMMNALNLMSEQNLQGLIFLSLFQKYVLARAGLGPSGLGPSGLCAEPEINVHISREQLALHSDDRSNTPPIIVVVIKG